MTIQPYKRLRLVPSNTPEGRRIAREIKTHQDRANAQNRKPKVTRWHSI